MRIVNFVVCDDIRREIGGKHTLVGVYDDLNVFVPANKSITWPLNIKLCFFCAILNEKGTLTSDKYEFVVSQESQQIASLSDSIKIPLGVKNDHINLALIINSISILKPGKLDFCIRFLMNGEIIEELIPNDFKINIVTVQQSDIKV